jgi:hypothetical protein
MHWHATTAHTAQHHQLQQKANLLVVKTLFSEMFSADTEMTKLKHLPGIEEIVEQFRGNVATAADALRSTGLERAALKAEQVCCCNCHACVTVVHVIDTFTCSSVLLMCITVFSIAGFAAVGMLRSSVYLAALQLCYTSAACCVVLKCQQYCFVA